MRIAVLVSAFLLTACTHAATGSTAAAMHRPVVVMRSSAFDNGRSIFMTGRDVDGLQIVARTRPLRQSCAACHGVTGAGHVHVGSALSADLRHDALVVHQRPPYTLPLLQRAISAGLDNQGKTLDPVMPRWKLSQRDLHDVALFVYAHLK